MLVGQKVTSGYLQLDMLGRCGKGTGVYRAQAQETTYSSYLNVVYLLITKLNFVQLLDSRVSVLMDTVWSSLCVHAR